MKLKAEESLKSLRNHYEIQLSNKNKEHKKEITSYLDKIGKLLSEVKELRGGRSSQKIETIEED